VRTIPATLVKALNDLGLSNYEASIYAALVLFDNAEAKEIIEFLGISKPSVYEALDRLEERGLAVKRVTKPARYSAISPEMAVSLLMNRHKQAADLALETLKTLEGEKIRTDKGDALWTIYGDANIEYKIRDLFGKAKHQIRCMIGERYLSIIRNCSIQDISLQLIVVSDTPDLEKELRKIFPGSKADIHVVPSETFLVPPPFAPPGFAKAKDFMNFENILELIVDDEELLMIPPFFSGTVSVLNTRNKGAIFQIKMINEMNWRRLIEGDGFSFPLPPGGKSPHKKKK
jgi:HTH-type transcriptional regulator, sugar sensing transcriptional regulator